MNDKLHTNAQAAAYILLMEQSKTLRDRLVAHIFLMTSILEDDKIIETYKELRLKYNERKIT